MKEKQQWRILFIQPYLSNSIGSMSITKRWLLHRQRDRNNTNVYSLESLKSRKIWNYKIEEKSKFVNYHVVQLTPPTKIINHIQPHNILVSKIILVSYDKIKFIHPVPNYSLIKNWLRNENLSRITFNKASPLPKRSAVQKMCLEWKRQQRRRENENEKRYDLVFRRINHSLSSISSHGIPHD